MLVLSSFFLFITWMKHDYLIEEFHFQPRLLLLLYQWGHQAPPYFPYNWTLHTRHRKWTGKIKKSQKLNPAARCGACLYLRFLLLHKHGHGGQNPNRNNFFFWEMQSRNHAMTHIKWTDLEAQRDRLQLFLNRWVEKKMEDIRIKLDDIHLRQE